MRPAPPHPVSLVIFDCDGVLIDSEIISAGVLVDEAARDGVVLSLAHVREHFLGRSFPTVAATIRTQFAVALPEDFERRYRARLLERFESELRLTPGVLDILAGMRVPFCVATSSSPPRLTRSLEIAGIGDFFPLRFTASEVAHGKPAPDLFLHAAARMGVAPDACLVIEDTQPGVQAARAAGMQVGRYLGASHMRGLPPPAEAPGVIVFDDWAGFPALWPGIIERPGA